MHRLDGIKVVLRADEEKHLGVLWGEVGGGSTIRIPVSGDMKVCYFIQVSICFADCFPFLRSAPACMENQSFSPYSIEIPPAFRRTGWSSLHFWLRNLPRSFPAPPRRLKRSFIPTTFGWLEVPNRNAAPVSTMPGVWTGLRARVLRTSKYGNKIQISKHGKFIGNAFECDFSTLHFERRIAVHIFSEFVWTRFHPWMTRRCVLVPRFYRIEIEEHVEYVPDVQVGGDSSAESGPETLRKWWRDTCDSSDGWWCSEFGLVDCGCGCGLLLVLLVVVVVAVAVAVVVVVVVRIMWTISRISNFGTLEIRNHLTKGQCGWP